MFAFLKALFGQTVPPSAAAAAAPAPAACPTPPVGSSSMAVSLSPPASRICTHGNPPSQRKRTPVRVRDLAGVEKLLGAELARGGEGTIHRVQGRDDVLVKIYHPRVLGDAIAAARLEKKIAAMTASDKMRKADRVAWPRLQIFDAETGRWCGYAMKRQPGISLQGLLGAPRNLLDYAPHWNRLHLVHLCLDFLDGVETLASCKTLPVDFNPCNFLVDVQTASFHFIDCDGYQFEEERGMMHLCEAVRPDMAAPELLQRQRWNEEIVQTCSLRFSVGMILFLILNLGNNPYRHRDGDDPVTNLLAGRCGLGIGADCALPKGPWYLIWSHLTYDLKNLFIRCFRDGHSDPAQRPHIKEWREAMKRYEFRLRTGKADGSLIPATVKQAEKSF